MYLGLYFQSTLTGCVPGLYFQNPVGLNQSWWWSPPRDSHSGIPAPGGLFSLLWPLTSPGPPPTAPAIPALTMTHGCQTCSRNSTGLWAPREQWRGLPIRYLPPTCSPVPITADTQKSIVLNGILHIEFIGCYCKIGYGWNVCVPQNSYVDAVIFTMVVFGSRALEEIRIRWGHESKAPMIGSVSL